MATPIHDRQDDAGLAPVLPLLPPDFAHLPRDPDAWLTDLYGPDWDLDPLRSTP